MTGDYNNLASPLKMARGTGGRHSFKHEDVAKLDDAKAKATATYRSTLEQLDASALERVGIANFDFIRESGIGSVEANVVYAVATKT